MILIQILRLSASQVRISASVYSLGRDGRDLTSLKFFSAPEVFIEEKKIGFFPPIKAAKPMKNLLEGGLEKDKVS